MLWFKRYTDDITQTVLNVLYNSLIIRLGKFGPLDYSHLSPLQISILSNNMSFITESNTLANSIYHTTVSQHISSYIQYINSFD